MRIVLGAIAFFVMMTAFLFKVTFTIPPTPMQYAFCVVWNACLAVALAQIFKRMSSPRPARVRREHRGG